MSDSPIFDQLFRELSGGKTWDQFFKFKDPTSAWSGSPKTGVRLGKIAGVTPSIAYMDEAYEGIRPASDFVQYDQVTMERLKAYAERVGEEYQAKKTGTWVHTDVLEANGIEIEGLAEKYVSQVGQDFAEHYPLAVVTDMHAETSDDGSATVVIEAVQPIASVKPLSERNTAEPME